jgi:hypothetical protein
VRQIGDHDSIVLNGSSAHKQGQARLLLAGGDLVVHVVHGSVDVDVLFGLGALLAVGLRVVPLVRRLLV